MAGTPDEAVARFLSSVPDAPDEIRLHALEVVVGNLGVTGAASVELVTELVALAEAGDGTLAQRLKTASASTFRRAASTTGGASVDLLLLAVKPVELDACLTALGVGMPTRPVALGRSGIVVWFAQTAHLGVAVAMIGTAGNVETATFLSELRQQVEFRSAILIGMCAGVSDEVNLGDVIVAETVYAYDFEVLSKSGPHTMAKPYSPPERDFRNIQALFPRSNVAQAQRIVGDARRLTPVVFPDDEAESLDAWQMRVKRAGLLAGAKLVENGRLATIAADVHLRVAGAEMEGAGFAAACDSLGVPWLVVRGVADYGEPDRKKHWQWPATYAAARVALEGAGSGILLARVLASDSEEEADRT